MKWKRLLFKNQERHDVFVTYSRGDPLLRDVFKSVILEMVWKQHILVIPKMHLENRMSNTSVNSNGHSPFELCQFYFYYTGQTRFYVFSCWCYSQISHDYFVSQTIKHWTSLGISIIFYGSYSGLPIVFPLQCCFGVCFSHLETVEMFNWETLRGAFSANENSTNLPSVWKRHQMLHKTEPA